MKKRIGANKAFGQTRAWNTRGQMFFRKFVMSAVELHQKMSMSKKYMCSGRDFHFLKTIPRFCVA